MTIFHRSLPKHLKAKLTIPELPPRWKFAIYRDRVECRHMHLGIFFDNDWDSKRYDNISIRHGDPLLKFQRALDSQASHAWFLYKADQREKSFYKEESTEEMVAKTLGQAR